jgi:3-hydroxypropanoate dehydrogenase
MKTLLATSPSDDRLFPLASSALPSASLDQLFRLARTYNEWTSQEVDDRTIHELYELLRLGPTSANCCPARFVWVKSDSGKAKLAALAAEMNRPKILAAPLTAIIGHDLDFPELMPQLFPARGEMLRQMFRQPRMTETTAMRNGTLQGAYLNVATRALGLDCGPMSGFDNAAVDREVFCGHTHPLQFHLLPWVGQPDTPFPRNPRLSFEEAGRWA